MNIQKNIVVVSLTAIIAVTTITLFYSKRTEVMNDFLSLSYKELKEIPKKDRPDLAALYDFKVTMDPTLGYPPKERLIEAHRVTKGLLKLKNQSRAIDNVEWIERGPNNFGGRTRAIMFDPNDPSEKKLWAGSVGGGLWYNDDITDSNNDWEVYDDLLPNLAISSLTYDPVDTEVFYFSTGEGWGNVDAIRGAGIWKSSDAGDSWVQLESMKTGFEFIQKVVVTGQSTVLAAVKSSSNSGIWRSADGGDTWSKVVESPGAELEVSGSTIYASTFHGTVLISTDDGVTWDDITPEIGSSRIELAVALEDPNIIYALGNVGNNAEWIYVSSDAGKTWSEGIIPGYFTLPQGAGSCREDGQPFTRDQGWFDLILAVAPGAPNTIIMGGIDLYRSNDLGQTWDLISYWTGECADYVHADQHGLIFRPSFPKEIISSNDGGISYCNDITVSMEDGGPDFNDRNKNYNVAQFYACAMANDSISNVFLAGAQDNGSHLYSQNGINSTTEVTGGDGAFCFIDQENPDIMITSYVYNNYYVSTNGMDDITSFGIGDDSGDFINPSEYDTKSKTLFASANSDEINIYTDLFSTTILEETKTIDIGSSQISAFALSPDQDSIFVGTYSGSIYAISDVFNETPITTLLGESTGVVSSISIGTENQMLVTYSNYGVVSVIETRDAGESWVDKEGNLPDMPVRWGLYNPNNTDQVLLATELGVWSVDNISTDDVQWEPSNDGLANVSCYQLRYREDDGLVAIATHGRGLYTSDVFVKGPMANFYTNVDLTYAGVEIDFINSSYLSTIYSWDFGDGTSSTEENTTHTFNEAGTYMISLEVESDPSNVYTKEITVLPILDADFELADGGDFESNSEYFVSVNLGGTAFELGESDVFGKSGTNSGENAWVIGPDSTLYEPWTESYLYTPAFDFSLSGIYTLEFYTQYEIEDEWDGFIVEYSIDGGANWSKLGNEVTDGWYNQLAIGTAIVFDPGKPFFSGDTGGEFVKKSIDFNYLSNNETVAFRFTFKTDPGAEEAGVAIDDFQLTRPTSTAVAVAFEVDTEEVCTGNVVMISNNSTGAIDSYSWDFGDGATPETAEGFGPFEVSYSTAGSRTVKLTVLSDDVESSHETSITVLSPPSNLNVTGSTQSCVGEQVNITIEGSEPGVQYSLIDIQNDNELVGETIEGTGDDLLIELDITVADNSFYKVVASNETGCEFHLLSVIQITGIEVPEVEIAENRRGELEASVEDAESYVWLLNGEIIDGAESDFIEPTEEGAYQVQIENLGCISTSESYDIIFLDVNSTLGFSIHPNPTSDFIAVSTTNKVIDGIQLMDLAGNKMVIKSRVKEHSLEIDIAHLPNGIYCLYISTPEMTLTKRIIKK